MTFFPFEVHLTVVQVDLELSHVRQASLKLMVILLELLKCWGYKCELSKQAFFFLETRSHYVAHAGFLLIAQVGLKLMAIPLP